MNAVGKVIPDTANQNKIVVFDFKNEAQNVAGRNSGTECAEGRVRSLNKAQGLMILKHEGEQHLFELLL